MRFTNLFGSTNLDGSFLIDGSIVVPSGNYYGFTNTNQHTAKTQNERFSTNKHHEWNGVNGNFRLQIAFQPPSAFQLTIQNANFLGMNSSTVRNELIDATGQTNNTGQVEFQEPWYLKTDGSQPNTFLPFSSPFTPTGAQSQQSGGVFLGQEVEAGTYY